MKRKLTILLSLSINFMLAQYSIVNSHLLERSVQLKIKDSVSIGSGFILTDKYLDSEYFYLVTAKHVIGNQNDKGLITLRDSILQVSFLGDIYNKNQNVFQINLLNLGRKGHIKYNIKDDIVLIFLGNKVNELMRFHQACQMVKIKEYENVILRPIDKSVIRFSKMKIGNDCFIVGYPTSLDFRNMNQFNFNKPLVRKGIIAGINETNKTIILDCQADKGNSGGPIFGYFPTENKINLIGVVSQFIPDSTAGVVVNSGYSVAVSALVIQEILNNFKQDFNKSS